MLTTRNLRWLWPAYFWQKRVTLQAKVSLNVEVLRCGVYQMRFETDLIISLANNELKTVGKDSAKKEGRM